MELETPISTLNMLPARKPTALYISSPAATREVTHDAAYLGVVTLIDNFRNVVLRDSRMREPYLQVLTATYNDYIRCSSAQSIAASQTVRHPTDSTILEFFEQYFPDVQLVVAGKNCLFSSCGITNGKPGIQEAGAEKIQIVNNVADKFIERASNHRLLLSLPTHDLGYLVREKASLRISVSPNISWLLYSILSYFIRRGIVFSAGGQRIN